MTSEPTTPAVVAEGLIERGFWRGLDHIANFINALDTAEMTVVDVRSAIYSECLKPTRIHLQESSSGR